MMALFGMPKRKGLFGNPYMDPPMTGTPTMPDPQPMGAPGMGFPAMEPQQPKMGLGSRLFGRGWEDKAFALGGLLQGDQTGVLMMRQEQQAQRDAAAAAQAAQLKRAQDLADFRTKEEIKSEYSTRSPYRWESNDGSLMEIGPDGAPRVVYQDPTPKVDWVTVNNPDGTKTIMPMQRGGAQGGAPGALPTFTEDDWKKAGGPAGNGGGNFPG